MRVIDLADFSIGSVPVGKETLRLRLFHFRDGTRLTVPAATVRGAAAGPTVTILAGQHGDEWNGPYIVHKLFQKLDPGKMKGTVILLPIANPPAFVEKSRTSRIDGVDMNRVYQFFKGHRPTEQLARYLFDVIFARSDYLLDLHSGGPGEYLPHLGALPKDLELARVFGFGHIIVAKGSPEEFVRYSGSLVPACERAGVTALLAEIGMGRAVQREWCKTGTAGVLNFLRAVSVVDEPVKPVPDSAVHNQKAAVKSPVPGIFTPIARLGDTVTEGDLIGTVTALMADEPFEAHATSSGTILYVRREEMVAEGESLYHIAWMED